MILRPRRTLLALAFSGIAASLVLALPASSFAWSGPTLWARWNALRGDAYALDAVERFVERPNQRPECDQEKLVTYSGATLRYHGAVRVEPAFRERLERFEVVVAETAEHVYGRRPRRIRHFGAFSCRLSRNRSHRLSEHALANAIDVVGFDFGAAAEAEPLPADLPRELRRAFQVRVARHWLPGTRATDQVHTRFLRELTRRLAGRRDIFRSMIGPSHPSHKDHFHFDVSPWRYLNL